MISTLRLEVLEKNSQIVLASKSEGDEGNNSLFYNLSNVKDKIFI